MPRTLLPFAAIVAATLLRPAGASGSVTQDVQSGTILIADDHGTLELRLNCDHRCMLDRVRVRGRDVVPEATGVCSAIKATNQWHTTRAGMAPVQVSVAGNTVTVAGIRFGGSGMEVEETWRFATHPDRITWRIDRDYVSGGWLEDTYFPGWDFNDMATWTGALLGHGGVAWGRLFDAPNVSYGVHTGKVVFWNKASGAALWIVPQVLSRDQVAVRFTRQPSGIFSFNYSLSENTFVPRHGLSRFVRGRQDIWKPFQVRPGRVSVEYTLTALDYEKTYDLGLLKQFDASTVREIRHTIARIGAVDELIHGSNGYYSDYAVLHEPWLAQLGLLIDDPGYTRAFADTLDFQRQHAIGADGRVKSRWSGNAGDAMRGTYDEFGYYETQWGYLLDSQPSWVINVAELFDLTGDRPWLERQKSTCERVLDYLLRRDSDGNGLVEMLTSSCKEARGSDWIDVVWASHENALVNAQLYRAMTLWADCENLLGDQSRVELYQAAARKLKQQFNRSTAEGGFWDPRNQCYAYWRDKDGSVHGTNVVIPVNFSAIGYGLCEDSTRRATILNHIENLMQQEQLFFWPLCFSSYAPGEAHPSQYPFPTYENGDLFLAWGELGTRAYAAESPAVAVKYVKSVLAQYDRDGLAFQRYSRKTQTGAGNDILANNCSTVVGLYRNIYGVQPRHNRLMLDPHLIPELEGTLVKYLLRGRSYVIELETNNCRMTVGEVTVQAKPPFGLNGDSDGAHYFHGDADRWSMSVSPSTQTSLELRIETWSDHPAMPRRWTQVSPQAGAKLNYVVAGLQPGNHYQLRQNGVARTSVLSDSSGRIEFSCEDKTESRVRIEIIRE